MEELNKTQIALKLGRSEATINRWLAAGCPHNKKAVDSCRIRPYFNLAAVRAWLETRTQKGGEA